MTSDGHTFSVHGHLFRFEVHGEDDRPCEVCGARDLDECVCPQCPICKEVGDPGCYATTENGGHGMETTEEQRHGAAMQSEQERLTDDARARFEQEAAEMQNRS
jgi:hypothetical protein